MTSLQRRPIALHQYTGVSEGWRDEDVDSLSIQVVVRAVDHIPSYYEKL